jgi:hypothetical protein
MLVPVVKGDGAHYERHAEVHNIDSLDIQHPAATRYCLSAQP